MRIRRAFEEDIDLILLSNNKENNKQEYQYFLHLLNNLNLHIIEENKIVGYFSYDIISDYCIIEEINCQDLEKNLKVILNYLESKKYSKISYYAKEDVKEIFKKNNFIEKNEYFYIYKELNTEIKFKVLTNFLKVNSLIMSIFNNFNHRLAKISDLNALTEIRKKTPEFEDELENAEDYYLDLIKKDSIFLLMDEHNNLLAYMVFNLFENGFCNIIDLVVLEKIRKRKVVIFLFSKFILYCLKIKKVDLRVCYGMVLSSNEKMLGFLKNIIKANLEDKLYLMIKA